MTDTPNHLPPPDSPSELAQFIEAAREKGASDEFISKLLRSFGWPQREIERAFYQVYERLVGYPIPAPGGGAGEAARDAFMYLLSFLTLALWTQALGEMAFIIINRSIPDVLNRSYGNPSWQVAFCLARLIVAYPIYLLVMRQILKELALYRHKSFSGVRQWLTNLTLLIAAIVGISTVIAFLASFLQGELTVRFVLKIAVILVIDGGVLWYYSAWLKRRPRSLRVQS